jgi:hypothetical protein
MSRWYNSERLDIGGGSDGVFGHDGDRSGTGLERAGAAFDGRGPDVG